MNVVQANELEMKPKDTEVPITGLVSVITLFVTYFLLFLLLMHHLDAAT